MCIVLKDILHFLSDTVGLAAVSRAFDVAGGWVIERLFVGLSVFVDEVVRITLFQ